MPANLRFRVWHLILAMALMAVWLPMAKWLLALEALDHANRPHTTMDFVGFYVGTTALVVVPVVLAIAFFRKSNLTDSLLKRRKQLP